MTAEETCIHICNLTTSVLGLRKGSLAFESREQKYHIPRMVASVIARTEEGIKHNIIAKVINRDRASIYHYEKSHSGNYTWQKYRDIFNQVYMVYRQIEESKKVFIDKHYMKEYLLKNGVKENAKAEAKILVKSGEVEIIINTSYFDFSNQLENIKFALTDYKYAIRIL